MSHDRVTYHGKPRPYSHRSSGPELHNSGIREIMIRFTYFITWCLGLLLLMGAAMAQGSRDTDLYLNGIRQTLDRLQSVAPNAERALVEGAAADPHKYQFNYTPTDYMSLRRNFTRTVVETPNTPLGMAYQESLETAATLALSSHTGASFTSTRVERLGLQGSMLSAKEVSVLGLRQSFGSGTSAGALALTRNTTTEMVSLATSTRVQTDTLDFKTGLRHNYEVGFNASRTESDWEKGPQGRKLAASLKMPFSGGIAVQSFADSYEVINGRTVETQKVAWAVPLAFNSGKGIAEHNSLVTVTNGVETKQRTTHFAAPLRLLGQKGSLDHLIQGVNKGQGLVETRTTKLVNPFRIGDRQFGAEETLITLRNGSTYTETFAAKLVAPLAGGKAELARQTVTVTTLQGETEQRQLAITLPSIKLNDRLAMTAQRISIDTSAGAEQDITRLSFTAKPFNPLQIEARYQMDDRGASQSVKQTNLVSKWRLSNDLMLQGNYNEAEVLGKTPNSLRFVELVRDRGKSGFGLRAGMASYTAADKELDDARRVEISLGRPKSLEILAAYTEYDPKNMNSFNDDAIISVAVQHGSADDLLLRYRYEDQPTRVGPARGLDVALPLLGGKLQLSYLENPLNPLDSKVRMADQYDASLGRKVFGDVNLELGYRYLDYEADEISVDQFVRLKLDGGKENRGGKLALSYVTGDFCRVPSRQPVPESMLDLTYSRVWNAYGRLSLRLEHRTPPVGVIEDSKTEGRLEYSHQF